MIVRESDHDLPHRGQSWSEFRPPRLFPAGQQCRRRFIRPSQKEAYMTAITSQENVQQRLKRRFERWDTDHSGSLTREDFEREADKVARQMGEDANSAKATQLKKALAGMCSDIARDGGAGSGPISYDQFNQAAQKWMESDEHILKQHLRPMVQAVVALADRSGNDKISREEFMNWLKAVGTDSAQARDAFDRIDTDADSELSTEELLQACVDFHLGRSDFELL
ncbi:EF-hand domain-containing protein [Actinophytocola glycyrrhizae]|uniref:EF-hand domain-containing protein n=1 Tax=Actinophytocola glycyrrhizae TaxID=2044873 RepID=A0ABV9RZG5_9PSEU